MSNDVVFLFGALCAGGLISRATFGSLNYDTLFEQEAMQAGFSIDWLYDAARQRLAGVAGTTSRSSSAIPVAKLHGSSNFLAKFNGHTRAMAAAPGIRIEHAIEVLFPIGLCQSDDLRQAFQDGAVLPMCPSAYGAVTVILAEWPIRFHNEPESDRE